MYELGVIKSPVDKRDWVVESLVSVSNEKLPESIDYRKDLPPIRDQGRQGSCSAQTAACIKEWQENKNVGYKNYLSPQFVYNNRDTYPAEGMTPRNTMKILQKLGICRERTLIYNSNTTNKISPEIYAEALNCIIKSYAQVTTIEGLKLALYKTGPCYLAVPVYSYGERMWYNDGSKLKGGHAMTIVGYNNQGFIIRNSWGSTWGDNGYCIFPYKDFGMHWEIWSVVDDLQTRPIVDPPPTPSGCCIVL